MSTFAVTNPNTGAVEETFESLSTEEIPRVIDKAHRAFQTWRETPMEERAAILSRAGDIFESRAEELADIIGHEMGKPKQQGIAEAKKVAFSARWYAKNAPEH
ncbi:MAG TPA: aldehyde dehydrogenase family protein, partial [Candidatus Nesterenkonia stercoripullorum]|nr:aldehyde dehydrogenase family protein [Candidatus Nesterenkonia stercoripullorum]